MFNIIQHHVAQNPSVYLKSLMRFYSMARKTHYEVLNLRRNCSDKEIKDAFIKLSKQYHPDRNKDANAQQQFVQIVEAYNVLGKPGSRATYDRTTYYEPYAQYRTYNVRRPQEHCQSNFYYDTTSYARTRSEFTGSTHSDHAYYGSEGIPLKRIPLQYLVLLCVGIAFVGTVLQVLVIRGAYNVNKKKVQERTEFLAEELNRVRDAARGRTNETQTRLLLERIVGSAHPTIATASLGQALANAQEK